MPRLSPENKPPHFTRDTWTTLQAKCSQTQQPFRGKYETTIYHPGAWRDFFYFYFLAVIGQMFINPEDLLTQSIPGQGWLYKCH